MRAMVGNSTWYARSRDATKRVVRRARSRLRKRRRADSRPDATARQGGTRYPTSWRAGREGAEGERPTHRRRLRSRDEGRAGRARRGDALGRTIVVALVG